MRKNRRVKTAYSFLCLLLAVMMAFPSYATEHIDNQISKQEEDIKKTEEEIDKAEEKQDKLEKAKAQMEKTLSGLNQQYNDITAQIKDLEQQIEEKKAEIEETQEELREAQAIADKQYADMKARIQYMYENPQAGFFEILLLEGSFAEALTRATNVASLAEYDERKMDEYIATKEAIAEKEVELQGEKAALDELHDQVVQKQQEVAELASNTRGQISNQINAIAKAQSEIDGKESTLADQKAVLEELIKEKKRIEAELEAKRLAEIAASLGQVTGVRTTEQEYVQYGAYPASEEEITALAVLIHCEAANQGMEGQLAVGAVVMNRIRDPRFAQNDIMSVIRAGGQFSPVMSGRFDLVLTQALDTVAGSCYEAARRAVAGESNVGNRTFFRTYKNYPSLSGLVIRDHIFNNQWNFPAE